MKIARLAGSVLVAIAAVSLVVASAAFAEPEFHPVGATFTGKGLGPEQLVAGGNTIKCTTNSTSGTISNATLAGGVVVTFTGCKSSKVVGTECAALSVGQANKETIVTNTLHGVLGLILPKGSGTGVGLLLLPVANKKFVEIEANACTVGTTVFGNVAGEVRPVGEGLKTGGLLLFQKAETGNGESIKDFDLSTGGLVNPEIEAFGAIASQSTDEDLTFSAAVEVS